MNKVQIVTIEVKGCNTCPLVRIKQIRKLNNMISERLFCNASKHNMVIGDEEDYQSSTPDWCPLNIGIVTVKKQII